MNGAQMGDKSPKNQNKTNGHRLSTKEKQDRKKAKQQAQSVPTAAPAGKGAAPAAAKGAAPAPKRK
jgi:hypothetical protein